METFVAILGLSLATIFAGINLGLIIVFFYYIGCFIVPQCLKGTKSMYLLISSGLGLLYSIYLVIYFTFINNNASGFMEVLSGLIATTLVLPHIILATLGVIFNFLALIMNTKGLVITTFVLYCIATILFLQQLLFMAPLIIIVFLEITEILSKEAKDNVSF